MSTIPKLASVSQIKKVLASAQQFLENEFTDLGTDCGWYHFLGEHRVGILGTAAGIISLASIDRGSPLISKAANQLMRAQIASAGQIEDGGWGLASTNQTPVTESSAWCAYALYLSGLPVSSQPLERARKWLEDNQNDDGGWGGAKGYQSRTYSTSIALRTLTSLAPHSHAIDEGVTWIERNQRSDGSWGEKHDTDGTPIHTAHAILGLLNAGIAVTARSIRLGVDWLHIHNDSWTRDIFESYELQAQVGSRPRIRIDHTVLPWVVSALIESGENLNKLELKLAVSKIVDSQHSDGYWKSERTDRISIFETQDSIIALKTLLDEAPSLEFTLELQDRVTLLENEFRRFLPTLLFLSGITESLSKISHLWNRFHWLISVSILSILYALLAFSLLRFLDVKEAFLYGSIVVFSGSVILAPGLSRLEKIVYGLTIVVAGLSIDLLQFKVTETITTVVFAALLAIAMAIYERRH